MKTWLTHNGSTRSETDAEIVNTLKRKGWKEIGDPTPPAFVPPVVVRRLSFFRALSRSDFIKVKALIASIQDPDQQHTLRVWFDEATEFERDHPLVLEVAAQLQKSDAEVDAIFAAAKALDQATS